MSHLTIIATVSTGLHADFATVLLFILFGVFFANLALGIAKLVRPSQPSAAKLTTYECGELPRGSSWVRFNIRFYLIALFFIVFDVEVIFIYPWAVVFKPLYPAVGGLLFVEMALFLGILVVGLIYIWAKGDLDWVKGLIRRGGTEVDGE
ncbi:NADH-quinone oxidoreductase subunit A [bacterium]|nr:NADH-quinone oxidoreductase subunit A [bacterium]MBU1072530.1 NADH-quinone oxidoreductase subunit A [bacterium]MBU1674602.1 NADH-quinone oxidoreductase subunit A [bacterium]